MLNVLVALLFLGCIQITYNICYLINKAYYYRKRHGNGAGDEKNGGTVISVVKPSLADDQKQIQ